MTTIDQAPTRAKPNRGGKSASLPVRPHVIHAIFKRDFLRYFTNLTGYVFIALFVLVSALVAFGQDEFFSRNLANLDTLNQYMPYLLLFFVPAITMSVWAEERRQGTDELLLTLPARDVEVVLGKYLAALGIYTIALAFSLTHVVVLQFLGRPDLGVMFATYVGYWLMGAMLLSIGMVASIVSGNVTVAFILGAVFCAIPIVPELASRAFGGLPGVGGSVARVAERLSVPAQFRDFGSGVIPLASVFYFVGMTAAMLYLNVVLLSRRHWAGGQESGGRWLHFLARVVCLVVALVSIAMMTAHAGFRQDVSAERLNTLSETSRSLIRQVPTNRPVYIQAFVSPEVPKEYVETKTNLVNLLREVASIGGGRIRLNLVEAERYSEAAREAEKKFGITPRRVMTLSEARQTSDEIFLGAAFTSGPEEVVVPFFDRGLPIEYEIVRSIRVVSGSKRKKVGILQTDARILGGLDFRSMNQSDEWEIVTELKKQYEVSNVVADEKIPSDLDALVVAQAPSLTQRQIDNLADFIRAGGPTLLMLDPLPVYDPELAPSVPRQAPGGMFGGAPPPEPKGDLTPLLEMLGVSWPSEEIVWNRYNPHPMLADIERYSPEFVFITANTADGGFGNDPATAGLQEVVFLFGGSLRPKGAALDFVPLIKTDELGGTVAYSETVQRGMFGMSSFRQGRPYFPSNQSYTMAARVKGKLPPAAEKAPDEATKEDEKKAAPAPSDKPVHVVLVADLDFISNTFFQLRRDRPPQYDFLDFDNVTFMLNSVDTLVGDESFLALRRRRPRHRTLEAIEAQAQKLVKANDEENKRADDAAREELRLAQERLDKKVEEVRSRQDLDERTKQIQLLSLQETENRRFEVTKATIDAKKDRAKQENYAVRENGVRTIHNRARLLAIFPPPLLPLLVGLIITAIRVGRENRGASSNRLV